VILPPAFVACLRPRFPEDGTEFADFLASFDAPYAAGIRAVPPRMSREGLRALLPAMGEAGPLGDVPWCPDGLAIRPDATPGRHPLHDAGLFYLQEPSAMLPVEVLAPRPGERVLDLCAAPGGKSVQIAARMAGEGFLLANDLHEDRARALVRNLERCGATNAAVTVSSPDRLAARFPSYFDRVLVDAPCSGEGMFRRDPGSTGRWAQYADGSCRREQDAILDSADELLKPGGRLVYSTCTFSPDEDEETVAAFLDRHSGYRLVPIAKTGGMSDAFDLGRGLSAAARIWPHRAPGDGHFCACLEKAGETSGASGSTRGPNPESGAFAPLGAAERDAFRRFAAPVLTEEALERFGGWIAGDRHAALSGGHVHVLPCATDLSRLHVLKRGFHLGTFEVDRKGLRFVPSHSFALVLTRADLLRAVELPVEDGTALRYLKGETVSAFEPDGPLDASGFAVATVMGFPLGWLKPMGAGQFKNLYPPGWRRQ
jgi:16S rRNA C967 or C1407 C5-methylase (RsmB/RsmF family)